MPSVQLDRCSTEHLHTSLLHEASLGASGSICGHAHLATSLMWPITLEEGEIGEIAGIHLHQHVCRRRHSLVCDWHNKFVNLFFQHLDYGVFGSISVHYLSPVRKSHKRITSQKRTPRKRAELLGCSCGFCTCDSINLRKLEERAEVVALR